MNVLESEAYIAPLYTIGEAADIVNVPTTTLRNWTSSYWYKADRPGLVRSSTWRGRQMLSFLGLEEAYVIAALKNSGIPMRRIRPAVERLKEGMGLTHALLSENLQSDGVEVLYEFIGEEAEHADGQVGLARVRDKQMIFRDAIGGYLQSIRYVDGLAASFALREYFNLVRVHPLVNGGQPSFENSGVRLRDVLERTKAGESIEDVAEDYSLPLDALQAVLARA